MSKEMTREEAYKLAMKACEETWNEKICEKIKAALSAESCEDAIGREKAEWIMGDLLIKKVCSKCGIFNNSRYKNYCPNCGAIMF